MSTNGISEINAKASTRRADSKRASLMEVVMFMVRNKITIEELVEYHRTVVLKEVEKDGKPTEKSRTAWVK